MFKRDGKLISYSYREGDVLPEGVEIGAYEYDGDQWQWTREVA